MRKWTPATWRQPEGPGGSAASALLAGMIDGLGEDGFATRLLRQLQPTLPAASWSAYQVGPACTPRLFLSGALDIPDTTRDCWGAYLSGPYRDDRSLGFDEGAQRRRALQLCHITAAEVAHEHRARVYEAHGMAERVSVVQDDVDGALFAVNFYRHAHQRPLTDAQIAAFEELAPALLALARKQVALRGETPGPCVQALRQRLARRAPALTGRELDVCARLLRGMTQDGIAADLGLSLPTVKTYRNRAFARLGIHFRNELFALVLEH